MSDWMDFLESPVRHGKSPFAYRRIWIWRPEWTNGPQACNPHEIHPQVMGVGLMWKPYDGLDAAKDHDLFRRLTS